MQERIRHSCPGSLLADLMEKPVEASAAAPWEHPHLASFQVEHRTLLWHGRHFSNIAHGAAILYNQMLAELRNDADLLEQHRETGHSWLQLLDRDFADILKWASDLPAFWTAVENRGHDIAPPTMAFVKQWIALLLQNRNGVFGQASARRLVREREIEKKRANSRFTNSRVRDQWGGSSGLVRMTYRWQIVQSYVSDMAVIARAKEEIEARAKEPFERVYMPVQNRAYLPLT